MISMVKLNHSKKIKNKLDELGLKSEIEKKLFYALFFTIYTRRVTRQPIKNLKQIEIVDEILEKYDGGEPIKEVLKYIPSVLEKQLLKNDDLAILINEECSFE